MSSPSICVCQTWRLSMHNFVFLSPIRLSSDELPVSLSSKLSSARQIRSCLLRYTFFLLLLATHVKNISGGEVHIHHHVNIGGEAVAHAAPRAPALLPHQQPVSESSTIVCCSLIRSPFVVSMSVHSISSTIDTIL